MITQHTESTMAYNKYASWMKHYQMQCWSVFFDPVIGIKKATVDDFGTLVTINW